MPSIVQLFVSQTVAPAPLTLQATGAIVSDGGTTLANGVYSLLTQNSDITPLLSAPLALSALTWSGGTVVATTVATIPGRTSGDVFSATIAGASPAGYNGTYLCSVTGSNTFTFALATNPGTATATGTYTPPGVTSLLSKVTTFFAQGGGQSVYVLELGPSDGTTGPPLLSAWLTTNPGVFYSFLVPGSWDAQSGFLALANQYTGLTAKTNFFIRTTPTTYSAYTNLLNDVFAMVQAPAAPLTEECVAAAFQHSLQYAPSSANRMTPFAFSFLFGVTPYPTVGNNTLLTQLKAANINYVGTGAEGGISNAILLWGAMLDGNDFTYWYSVDWIQLNTDQALANAVINGSNNPLNPLYYDQNGINVLQDVVVQTVQDAITFGLANGTVARAALDGPVFEQALDAGNYIDQDVVNAVPFITYVTENPSAYKTGSYGGLSLVYIPQRGFTQILFFINVTQFLTQ
jgi:hypothetical protein